MYAYQEETPEFLNSFIENLCKIKINNCPDNGEVLEDKTQERRQQFTNHYLYLENMEKQEEEELVKLVQRVVSRKRNSWKVHLYIYIYT